MQLRNLLLIHHSYISKQSLIWLYNLNVPHYF
nr:MAG TPA: hypothetical protein [Caudoviricetes sp.]